MKKRFAALYVAVLALALTGCVSNASVTRSTPSVSHQSTSTPTTTPTDTPSATPTMEPAVVSTQQWTQDTFKKGIQVYWHTNHDSDEVVAEKANRVFNYMVRIGANSLGISFPIYVDGEYPKKVYSGSDTPSVHELTIVLNQAKLHNLRVIIRPLINEDNIATNNEWWRGTIEPQNMTNWFASYQSVIAPYIDLAASEGVSEFVLGTELGSLQDDQTAWDGLASFARQYFPGDLSFAVNWTNYEAHDYGPYQITGIDAYPEFTGIDDNSSIQTLTSDWTNWLLNNRPPQRNLTIQEVGIPAQSGAYQNPAYWGNNSNNVSDSDQQIQAKWYTAACTAAKATEMKGIFFWSIDSNADPSLANPVTDSSGNFIGRAGEAAIKQCFSS